MKRPKKEIVRDDGTVLVWCSGCKEYHTADQFYPVSGRRYDTYCKEQRKLKEKSFYYRFKHNNPDYRPTIRRIDNAHRFEREFVPQKERASASTNTTPSVVTHDAGGRRLLISRVRE